MAAEKITYGIRNVHYAAKTEDENGAPIYGTVKRWPGAREISLPPAGESVKVFADDVIYFKLPVNQGYEGNLTVVQVPEDFKINHMGEYKDANGVLIEKANAIPLDFALLGEFQTDDSPKRFALYNCSAGRADFSGKTKEESIEPDEFSIPIVASPTVSDEIVKATVKKSDNEAVFNSWFDSVYYNPSSLALYKVSVTVNDGANPIAGAVVVVGDKVAKTNSSGIAAIMMGAGTFDVMVSAAGFSAATTTATVTNAAVSVTVTMEE